MDYRFRAEQDWNSTKSDGTYRDNRSRLRYRLRVGATYSDKHYSFGLRIRTGDQRKQQDPQLTLGKGLKEFGTLPIGFEKLFFQYKKNSWRLGLGKNTYPFRKSNELFWSDNVFPEGITIDKKISLESGILKEVNLVGGHYILASNDGSFLDDAYFQGLQSNFIFRDHRYQVSSALYLLRNIPNIPDGEHTHLMNFSIFHMGAQLKLARFILDFDYYNNLHNYDNNPNVEEEFKSQKIGYSVGVQYGNLNAAKKCMLKLTYAYLERFSILDYMAQNDWARWDYSSYNSPDGRLSNFRGIEAVLAYAITKKANLVFKYYFVDQLIPFGIARENGQRVRLDLNIKL